MNVLVNENRNNGKSDALNLDFRGPEKTYYFSHMKQLIFSFHEYKICIR